MNEMETNDKIFFQPGDVVTLKQDIPNRPTMIVLRKELNVFKEQKAGINLKGIRCRWFTEDMALQEAVFSTKDLVLVKSVGE